MKIVLHAAQFNSPFGILCSAVTLSGYSHGSIVANDGQCWDTTFKRGGFGKTDIISCEPEREIIIVDIPNVDPSEFLECNAGRKYDVMGLLLWPWRKENPNNWYCFEAINECLKHVGIDLNLGKSVSAKTILNGLLAIGYKAHITKGKHYDKATNY